MSNLADETKEARAGEELNVQNLHDYLRSELSFADDQIIVKQFPAGSSNLTYLVQVGAREFVLRRPPFGNTVRSAHDMNREFRVLSKLSRVYPTAPRPILYCDDVSLIGSEFYLMERKTGVILRGENVPEKLSKSPELQQRVCQSFISNLAALHNIDLIAAGLEDLGKPAGYAQRQVVGWTERYLKAQTDEWPELENSIKWLNEHLPEESNLRATLVHNDYKFDNIMLDPHDLTKITGVLDWEMCTVGNPLMDLGTTLGYWMDEKAPDFLLKMPFNPGVLMLAVSRRELAEQYAEETGIDTSNLLFYYVFGTFKIAVIAQQIYVRFARGATQDKRFASFNRFVEALGKIAARAIETEQV